MRRKRRKATRRRVVRRRRVKLLVHYISFAEANRARRDKGRKRLTRTRYNYLVARHLPVTIA